MPISARNSRSKRSISIEAGSGWLCSAMSISAEEAYSTVAKPWLKVEAFSMRATSSFGMGLPVW